jgi:hypothetical protein
MDDALRIVIPQHQYYVAELLPQPFGGTSALCREQPERAAMRALR